MDFTEGAFKLAKKRPTGTFLRNTNCDFQKKHKLGLWTKHQLRVSKGAQIWIFKRNTNWDFYEKHKLGLLKETLTGAIIINTNWGIHTKCYVTGAFKRNTSFQKKRQLVLLYETRTRAYGSRQLQGFQWKDPKGL